MQGLKRNVRQISKLLWHHRMVKRSLTPEQHEASKRLRRVWQIAKGENPELTQERVASLCGWESQSSFAHLVTGRVPLNFSTLLKLAKVLKTHPSDIFPELWSQTVSEMAPFGGGDTWARQVARKPSGNAISREKLADCIQAVLKHREHLEESELGEIAATLYEMPEDSSRAIVRILTSRRS